MNRFQFLQSLLAILLLIKNKTRDYFYKSYERGLFLGLGAILALFLFGISVFGYCLNLQSLTASAKDALPYQGLFAESPKNFLIESPEMSFLQKNSLIGVSSPITITSQTLGTVLAEEDETRKEIIEYTVKSGETVSGIAENFGISLETILWANELSSNSTIKSGQELIILPVSGVIYHIQKDDTLSGIAKTYEGNVQEIITFNELPSEGDIYVGDILVIPGGQMPKKLSQVSLTPLAESYFIFPSQGIITQGLHLFNAVDIGNKCGGPVVAAASGTIQAAGWARNAGNRITILHPNGVATYYGHLSAILVKPGQAVSTGDIIGFIGNTGYTLGATGCHLHFGVSGAVNFLAKYPVRSYLSWKK